MDDRAKKPDVEAFEMRRNTMRMRAGSSLRILRRCLAASLISASIAACSNGSSSGASPGPGAAGSGPAAGENAPHDVGEKPASGGSTATNGKGDEPAGSGIAKPMTPPMLDAGGSVPSDGGAGASARDAAPPPQDTPCDDADRTPPATPFAYKGSDTWTWTGQEDTPNTGPYQVTIESDPTLEFHTIYRPEFNARPLPIVAWANGGGLKVGTDWGEFLREIASYGFLIIADGTPDGSGDIPEDTTAAPLIKAIDWAFAENERPCSIYYHKLATDHVAVMGQSLGGLMAMQASPDPRVTTTVGWDTGLFDRDPALYAAIHAPVAIIDGGPDDIAYENGKADFEAINDVPILFANDQSGHGGTYWDDNGGEYAAIGVAWLSWQLLGDTRDAAKGMFVGNDCGLCKRSDWTVQSKMLR
jgi:hypothetical protein